MEQDRTREHTNWDGKVKMGLDRSNAAKTIHLRYQAGLVVELAG